MAHRKVNSRTKLIDYCLRRLGHPVIEINVEDQQLEDRIDDGLQLFREYAADGSVRVYFPVQITQAHIDNKKINIVLDPVMVAKGGHRLLKKDAVNSLKKFIKNTNPVLTPNIPEAEILTGMKINNLADMKTVGEKMIDLGANFVVLKGGHMNKPILSDILIGEEVLEQIEIKKIETNNTHGTGCTMASALTAGLAKSLGIKEAFQKAHFYVNQAIITSPRFGNGHGPINHSFNIN